MNNIKKLKVVFNSPTAAIPGHVIKEDTEVESPVALVPVGGGSHGKERQVDYAKLFAAAPDLLAACISGNPEDITNAIRKATQP